MQNHAHEGGDGAPRWTAEEAEHLIDQLQQQAAQLQEQAAELELLNDELSGNEARLRGVFEAALDAIVVTDTASRILEWNHQAEALFGWSAQEALGRGLGETIIPERFREGHERGVRHYLATGEGPILNRRIRIAALRRDGHEFPVELTVAPARWGPNVVFTAFVRDLTEHERAERHLATQYAVTRVLAESQGEAHGISRTLQAVGESLGWDMGLFWAPREGELHLAAIWMRPELHAAEFEAVSRAVTFARGAGLPGRVWNGGRPAWIRDVARDGNFSRTREAAAAGVHAAFAFPVAVGEEFLGVMEFFQRPVAEPDDALLEMMAALGTDIGQFLKWAHAEQRLRERDERQRFFMEVNEQLAASTPDYAATLRSLAALAVPALGDWCSVYTRDPDGEVRRLTTTHADPGKAELAEALSRYPHKADGMVMRAIESGEPVLMADIPEGMIEASAEDPEHARLLLGLEARSAIVVPLRARGRMLGAIALVTGAHGRRYGDEELRTAMEFAQRAALGVDNARLYAQAQEANRVKAEFLATMSHELRTPLNAMIGYTDLLEAGIPEPITAGPLEYVHRVGVSARHLAQLIDEILTFSRVEAGRETVALREVELEALVAEVRVMVEPLALERALPLEMKLPAEPVRFHSDPAKVKQILINLLGNAIKFTDQGRVELRAYLSGRDVVLSVCDTGIGISPENLERIFDPFWQVAQGTTREAEGTGLGLSVARRLAELLGGSLVVRSTPDHGSTFDLCLPISGPSGAPV